MPPAQRLCTRHALKNGSRIKASQECDHHRAERRETGNILFSGPQRAKLWGGLTVQFLRCIIGPSGLTSCIALSPFEYEGRIGRGREPNVVGNVKTAQNQQLRSAERAWDCAFVCLGRWLLRMTADRSRLLPKGLERLSVISRLREGAEIGRSVITGLLWGERSDSQARASLRQTLSELRGALKGSVQHSIIATKDTVSWVPGSAWIDAKVVEASADSDNENELREAAELVGGELMEGLAVSEAGFEQWLASERERFRLLGWPHLRTIDGRCRAQRQGGGGIDLWPQAPLA